MKLTDKFHVRLITLLVRNPTSRTQICVSSVTCDHHLSDIKMKLYMFWSVPRPKHVEFHSKNKFEKLVHLVGFIIKNLTRFMDTWVSKIRMKLLKYLSSHCYEGAYMKYVMVWLRQWTVILYHWMGIQVSNSGTKIESWWCALNSHIWWILI